jgi:hypothetical protein
MIGLRFLFRRVVVGFALILVSSCDLLDSVSAFALLPIKIIIISCQFWLIMRKVFRNATDNH